MSRQIIDQSTGEKKFDTTVHVRDKKGVIVDVRPYSLTIEKGVQTYLCKRTGNVYQPNGDLISLGEKGAKIEAAKAKDVKKSGGKAQASQAPVADESPEPILADPNAQGL